MHIIGRIYKQVGYIDLCDPICGRAVFRFTCPAKQSSLCIILMMVLLIQEMKTFTLSNYVEEKDKGALMLSFSSAESKDNVKQRDGKYNFQFTTYIFNNYWLSLNI